jgi:hypothetical protein
MPAWNGFSWSSTKNGLTSIICLRSDIIASACRAAPAQSPANSAADMAT